MKIGIYTEHIDGYLSGGLLYIVSILNELANLGHDVCAFVDGRPVSSWIGNNFPIYRSNTKEYKNFDGMLISPFTPTAQAVADHPNARGKYLNLHSNEALFPNDKLWRERAAAAYTLPLRIFCTSRYVRTILEQVYCRNVISVIVPPGYDPEVFNPKDRERLFHTEGPIRVVVFGRGHHIRGTDAALTGIQLASQQIPLELRTIPDGLSSRVAFAQYLKWADVVVDASRLAGSPILPREAQACGAVNICTDYGTPEIVFHGLNGFLVGVDNPNEIAQRLIQYYQSPVEIKKELHHLALQAMVPYTWYNVAQLFVEALKEGEKRNDWLLQKKQW